MNFFGKNIDQKTIDTISQMLNSPQGQKIKQELSMMDKNALLQKLNQVDLSKVDFNEVTKTLEQTNQNELMQKIQNIDLNQFTKKE